MTADPSGADRSESADGHAGATEAVEYGETWVYESIIGAVPGVDLSRRAAFAVQFGLFEASLLALAAVYGLWDGALAGTVAVALATVGSFEMLRISRLVRRADLPAEYRRAMFGSSIEVVLGLLAFLALLTYLFVVDPREGAPLVADLLGETPPAPAVYLLMLVAWDVCYRIGTGWWASVAALWRSLRYSFGPERRRTLRRADLETLGFALLQLVLAPFLVGHPVLFYAVVGHVAAVAVVTGLSLAALSVRGRSEDRVRNLSP
ncbi:MAG: hypothetical protein V5A28_03850 [Haloarculaceae archaeon]